MIAILMLLVAPQDLVKTNDGCWKCHDHEDEKEAWSKSVHAQKNVGCVQCHGADKIQTEGRSSPHHFIESFIKGGEKTEERIDSIAMCGRGHKEVLRYFQLSTHWEKVESPDEVKWIGCQNCHAFHDTRRADPMAILQRKSRSFPGGCASCHKPGRSIRKKADAYLTASGGFRESFLRLKDRIEKPVPGVSQAEEESVYEECVEFYHEARTRQHSCLFDDKLKSEEERKALKDGLDKFDDTGENADAAYALLVEGQKVLKDFLDEFGRKGQKADVAYERLVERDKWVSSRYPILAGFIALLVLTLFLVRSRIKRET